MINMPAATRMTVSHPLLSAARMPVTTSTRPTAESTAPANGAPASVAPASGAPAQPAPAAPTAGFPREYLVEVSLDGTTWKPAATGTGTGRTTTATFAPVQARFVRVTQTASTPNAPAWSIQRFRLYKATAVDGTR